MGVKQGKKYDPSDTDRQYVARCVAAGDTINDIADSLNLSDDTVRKYFRYEIKTSRMSLKAEAVRVVISSLEDDSLDAAKYVLSRVAGWSETQKIEADIVNHEPVVDMTKLSPDALKEIIAAQNEPD